MHSYLSFLFTSIFWAHSETREIANFTGVNPCKTPTGDSVPRKPPGLRHEGSRAYGTGDSVPRKKKCWNKKQTQTQTKTNTNTNKNKHKQKQIKTNKNK